MKKWIIPLAYPFASAFYFLLIGALAFLGNGDGTGYGGVVIILGGITLYCVILVPTICFLYSKLFLSGQKLALLFTLYPSLLITLPYIILFAKERETIVYSIILFVWCELWTLLGSIKFKRKTTKQDTR